ncbi:serine/threonine-protein kinase CTR1 isoform X2 [Quercus suber]|uniref:serine/threonine-protein kinase CTR1 isoform X2 n=1 Tax=Quercus suber TaxID=58331 RepID=UPI000CE18C93|nr:serine/threonine-protein kinase CTR1-like isoform X3 [Quercus suber]
MVDLLGTPGALSQPDSLLNGTASILVSSPLCHPRFKPAGAAENSRTLAKLYFNHQLHHCAFDAASSGTAFNQDHNTGPKVSKAVFSYFDRNNAISTSSNNHGNESVSSSHELKLIEDKLDIPWSELVLKKKIGTGSFGVVHHADWRGSVVAAVGFKGERLDIPNTVNHEVAALIEACWASYWRM